MNRRNIPNSLVTFERLSEEKASKISEILEKNKFPVHITKLGFNQYWVRSSYDGVKWFHNNNY